MDFILQENENLKQQNQLLVAELKKYQVQYQTDQATIANLTRVGGYPAISFGMRFFHLFFTLLKTQRLQAMEGELLTVRQMLSEEQHRNADLSQKLQASAAETQALQTKFKKLTDMYTTMRNEHLELLKQKQQFTQGREQMVNAKQAFEKLQRVSSLFFSPSLGRHLKAESASPLRKKRPR